MKIRTAFYLAGAILVVASVTSLFEQSKLIWATLMVVVAIVLLVWGYQKDQQSLRQCLHKTTSLKKIAMVTASVVVVFFGLGFAMGKLIYLWMN